MAAPAKLPNMLYYGDNLPILRNRDYFPSETIDLVYLDPPFNSNQDYNVLFAEQDGSRSAAQIRAFDDTWRWDEVARRTFDETVEAGGAAAEALLAFQKLVGNSDILAYLSMMAPRLVELRRVLKPTGNIFLHCDPTASHYLKMLLDSIFSPENFRNEIIWRNHNSNKAQKAFGPIHQTILLYGRSPDAVFYQPLGPYTRDYIETFFKEKDERGAYQANVITGPGVRAGDSGKPWRTEDPTAKGRHWQPPSYLYEKYRVLTGKDLATYPLLQRLDKLDEVGLLHISSKGGVRYRQYLDDLPGAPIQDIWSYQPGTEGCVYGHPEWCIDEDVRWFQSDTEEKLGYPTQKPEGLLERIIRSGSQEGDTVLDPFCGCGTTIAAAQNLKRRWIGIDITHLAITLIRSRLADAYGNRVPYKVVGEPEDFSGAEMLAKQDRYQFQWWALGRVGARPLSEERKKGADAGIDGKLFFREKRNGAIKAMVIQVKSGALKLSEVRDFAHVIEREKAQIGVLLTLEEPSRDMRDEAAQMGFYKPEYRLSEDDRYGRYQILTIRDLFEGKEPKYPPFRNVTFRPAPEAKLIKKRPGRTHRLSAKSVTGSEPRTSLGTFEDRQAGDDADG